MSGQSLRLCVNSVSHFMVDFACALLIFHVVGHCADAAALFMAYNACAFALQMPIGLAADRLGRNAVVATAGCALVAGAFALTALPFVAAVVAGIGNALFHVGGGLDTLHDSQGRAAPLGIFVSPGALGLFVGGAMDWALFPAVLAGLALCALALLLLARAQERLNDSGNPSLRLEGMAHPRALLPAMCLFGVVVLRSFTGMTPYLPWKTGLGWGAASVLAMALGKCAGGFAMDRFGLLPASLASLIAAGALFLWSSQPLAGLAAIFLFNLSMPMTLAALARLWPGCQGFAFGTLTFALFCGFVPVGLGMGASPPWLLSALCLVSATLMLPAGRVGKERKFHAG